MQAIRAFLSDRRAAAVTEFALLAPLFVVLLAFCVEVGRAMQAYWSLGNAVSGIARQIAAFPEYDSRARDQALRVAPFLLPPDWSGNFHLHITSLKKENGVMKQSFAHALFGSEPNAQVAGDVPASQFEEGEFAIRVVGAYDYRPLFVDVLPAEMLQLTRTHTISPFFSRNYVWNGSQAVDRYVK